MGQSNIVTRAGCFSKTCSDPIYKSPPCRSPLAPVEDTQLLAAEGIPKAWTEGSGPGPTLPASGGWDCALPGHGCGLHRAPWPCRIHLPTPWAPLPDLAPRQGCAHLALPRRWKGHGALLQSPSGIKNTSVFTERASRAAAT